MRTCNPAAAVTPWFTRPCPEDLTLLSKAVREAALWLRAPARKIVEVVEQNGSATLAKPCCLVTAISDCTHSEGRGRNSGQSERSMSGNSSSRRAAETGKQKRGGDKDTKNHSNATNSSGNLDGKMRLPKNGGRGGTPSSNQGILLADLESRQMPMSITKMSEVMWTTQWRLDQTPLCHITG